MKFRHLILLFIFALFCSANFAQSSMLPDARMEEEMRELIRDSVIYDCFIQGVVLEKKFKQELIKEADYIFQKNELLRLKTERKNKMSVERIVLESNIIAAGAETTIAVNPNDPSQVVAAFMINGVAGGCRVFYSNDAGQTWNPSTFIPENMIMATIPGVSSVDGGGDPVLTVDNNGVFYFAWIGAYTAGTGNYYSTLYVTSSDGGLSFTAPSATDFTITEYDQNMGFGFFDRIWISADASSGSTSGTIYLNGILYDLGDGRQEVYVKPAGSPAFTASPYTTIPVTPGYLCQMANVEVGDNGVVHASGIIVNTSDPNIIGDVVYTRSTDQGITWSAPVVVGNTYIAGGAAFYEENCAPSLGVDSNTVYLAWTKSWPTEKVYYAVSTDDGITWSAPLEVGPAVSPGPYAHLFINLSPSNGNCSMAWYRIDTVTLAADYIMAEIRNDGALPLSYEVISPGLVTFSGDFFGHYNVCRRNGCVTHAIWVDGAAGQATVYTAKVDACGTTSEITPISSEITFHSLYPVPAKDDLSIDLSVSSDAMYTISVFDIKGRSALKPIRNKFSKGKNHFVLDVSTLASGTYLLRIEKENGVYLTRKFVK